MKEYIDRLENIDYFNRLEKIRNYESFIDRRHRTIKVLLIFILSVSILVLATFQDKMATTDKIVILLTFTCVILCLYILIHKLFVSPAIDSLQKIKKSLRDEKNEIDIQYQSQSENFNSLNNQKYTIDVSNN